MKFLIKEKDKYKSGVYVITNDIDSRIYVGSTANLYPRYKGHLYSLATGKHNIELNEFCIKYSPLKGEKIGKVWIVRESNLEKYRNKES